MRVTRVLRSHLGDIDLQQFILIVVSGCWRYFAAPFISSLILILVAFEYLPVAFKWFTFLGAIWA